MNYRLLFTRKAVRDIKRLDPETKERIGRTLPRYEKDPLRYAEKLTHSELGSQQPLIITIPLSRLPHLLYPDSSFSLIHFARSLVDRKFVADTSLWEQDERVSG